MAVETALPTVALLLQIAKLCRDLLAERGRGKDTRKTELALVRLFVDLCEELRFCQDVGDSVRHFQNFFGLAVYRLREAGNPDELDREVATIENRFRTEFLNEIAAVVEDRRGRMCPESIPDLPNRRLRTELIRASANYYNMIESIRRLTLDFARRLHQMSREKDDLLASFTTESVQSLEDIRDYQAATVRSLIRTASQVAGLIS